MQKLTLYLKNRKLHSFKKGFLCLLFSLLFILTYAQDQAQWNFVLVDSDSIPLTKMQIYKGLKAFIADRWDTSTALKKADLLTGEIIVKGSGIIKDTFMKAEYTYVYNYWIWIRFNNYYYNTIIHHINCDSAYSKSGGNLFKKIRSFELVRESDRRKVRKFLYSMTFQTRMGKN